MSGAAEALVAAAAGLAGFVAGYLAAGRWGR